MSRRPGFPSRRSFLRCAGVAALAPGAAFAAAARPRVVYTAARIGDQLKKWYAERGLVDGRDVDLIGVDFRGLAMPATEARAREVLASSPNVVVVAGWNAVFTFQRATRTVPLVFVNFGGDPVRMGFVESLRQPGRNMTGSCQQLMYLTPKFFELLREIKPGGRRGGVLITQATTGMPHMAYGHEQIARASALLGMEIVEVVVPNGPTLEQVAAAIERAHVDYLFVPEDVYSSPALPRLIAHFERVRLPALYLYPVHVRNGGLMSMSYDVAEGYLASIDIVARILRGESPATIPVYMSTRYQIAVNRRTARAMGFEVPASILTRADEVVD